MVQFILNGESRTLDVAAETPLLWALRENAGLTGTKFGCGIGACGACTVHINGKAVRSCMTTAGSVAGASVTTIEGLATPAGLHRVQTAWIAGQVPQCGYCQSGMIMAVSALLATNPQPTDEDINAAITNICRCATYERIRQAIHAVANAGVPATAGVMENKSHG